MFCLLLSRLFTHCDFISVTSSTGYRLATQSVQVHGPLGITLASLDLFDCHPVIIFLSRGLKYFLPSPCILLSLRFPLCISLIPSPAPHQNLPPPPPIPLCTNCPFFLQDQFLPLDLQEVSCGATALFKVPRDLLSQTCQMPRDT